MFTLMVIVAVIVLIVINERQQSKNTQSAIKMNQQWMDYIENYKKQATKPVERALLDKMLSDLELQNMPAPSVRFAELADLEDRADQTGTTEYAATTSAPPVATLASEVDIPTYVSKPSQSLDTETMLLYFGAFLFVAAAGLFVGFGTAIGEIRLAVILTVLFLMYGAGLWLYDNKPKLKIAGLTFIGIGLMLAPLSGVAAYSFLFREQPAFVWFATSLLCLGLYGHALRRLRNPLLEYIFLGTALSLFESMISVVDAPVYYYGWMLALYGLGLQAYSMWKRTDALSEQPSSVSAQLLLPVSLIIAVFLVPEHGYVQLGVSAMLAAMYYGLAAVRTTQVDARGEFAIASQVLCLTSLGNFAFAYRQELHDVAVVLMVLSAVQLILLFGRVSTSIVRNATTVTIISAMAAVVFAMGWAELFVSALVWLAILSVVVWLGQRRAGAYVVAVWSLAIATLSYGMSIVEPAWSAGYHAAGLLGVVGLQLLTTELLRGRLAAMEQWNFSRQLAFAPVLMAAVFAGVIHGGWTAVAVSLLAALATLPLTRTEQPEPWVVLGGVILCAPLLVTWDEPAQFLGALVVALVWNIVLAIKYRYEANRWLGTFLWLLLPVALSHYYPQTLGSSQYYAWAYVVAAVGLLYARAIATGRVLQSGTVPVVSYLKTASVSYVFGYLSAFVFALVAAVLAEWYVSLLVVSTIIALTYVASLRIERQPDGLAAVPILLQVGLWSAYGHFDHPLVFVLLSSTLAVASYYLLATRNLAGIRQRSAMHTMSVYTAYVAPVTMLVVPSTWAMPCSLLIAGLLTLDYTWRSTQANRELAAGVMILAVLWWMSYAGVRNFQAYTHVIAAALGAFAYWRTVRKEPETSHQYLIAMLAMASIPLALQAMFAADKGGLYGWWFLCEQVGIMLLGVALQDKFVIRWGLYAAVLAVLYQLRDLGWAALTFLALFIIGMAVYRLQKSEVGVPDTHVSLDGSVDKREK